MGQIKSKFKALSPTGKVVWSTGIAIIVAGLVILSLWLGGILFKSDDTTAAPTSTTTTQSETVATVTPTATS